jgi:hypothetical protein
MSKFLLNLLVQISKALVYSKIKFYPSPPAPPELDRAATASRHSPRHPAPALGMLPEPLPAHHHFPPFNLAPIFNGAKAINATSTPWTPLSGTPPTPIKG